MSSSVTDQLENIVLLHYLRKTVQQNNYFTGPEPAAKKPAILEKIACADQSSPTPISQRAPRPKEPPPPLPKAAPKGPAAVNKTTPLLPKTPPPVCKTPPTVHKTPLPLPKTVPRVSVKLKENSVDSVVKHDETNNTDAEVSSAQTFSNNEQKSCDESKVDSDDSENNSKSDAEDFSFGNLKSRFVSSNENSSKVAPKIPTKPKPLPKGRPTYSPSACSSSSVLTKTMETDFAEKTADKYLPASDFHSDKRNCKSEWYIRDSPEKDISGRNTIEADGNNSAIQFLSGNQGISESTVWFNKSDESPNQSPKHSPVVPRKPLPKPPPKPSLSKNTEVVSNFNNNDIISSSSESSPIKASVDIAEKVQSEDYIHSLQKGIVSGKKLVENSTSDSITKESAKVVIENSEIETGYKKQTDKPKPHGSPKPLPKPIPRRTAPVPKPRPTPKKRLSINRLSGTEETFENHADDESVEKLSSVNQVNDRNERECLKNIADKTVKQENLDKKRSPELKERTVISDSGEEQHYRVIDKTISRPQSHITELEHAAAAETVILRKKVTRQESDSDEELTIEQLKSIEHLLEASDEDNDDNKFISNISLPVANDEGNVNNIETDADKNKEQKDNLKGSFENLDDQALLESTSLLNEIEDILTRSFKHSSLTRSGSSPEKKSSPFLKANGEGRAERSKSVDAQSNTPVRPPRPKKEQKKLRSMSQVLYDSCGSDTESLPDLTRNREGSFNADCANISLTLGKAKPHPPKPKRHKLLKVQRSQSDITAMKSVVDKLDRSDSKSPRSPKDMSSSSQNKADSQTKQASWRKTRPTRKAPPPPQVPPLKVTPASPEISLNTVIPVDSRVKSMQLNRDLNKKKSLTSIQKVHASAGPFYHSINDDHRESSDGEHDYQDIPDENMKNSDVDSQFSKYGKLMNHQDKEMSPPKLPPRNLNNSHSFDTSSLSSAGHDFDSVITGDGSSTEDMSVYPKTSSPFVKNRVNTRSDENMVNSGLGPSNSSLSDGAEEKKRRPVSGCSAHSDSWSGSHEAEQSSSDSELDDESKVKVFSIL